MRARSLLVLEYVTEFDLLAHCRMVMALRKDMGM